MSREVYWWCGLLGLALLAAGLAWVLSRKDSEFYYEFFAILVVGAIALLGVSYHWAGYLFFESQYPEPQQEVAKDGNTGN